VSLTGRLEVHGHGIEGRVNIARYEPNGARKALSVHPVGQESESPVVLDRDQAHISTVTGQGFGAIGEAGASQDGQLARSD
jgi:hypothetical protein